MATDVYIHILEHISEHDVTTFLAKHHVSFPRDVPSTDYARTIANTIAATPSVWVGNASWLKSRFFGEKASYIPATMTHVLDIIGVNLPVIDDMMITAIRRAFDVPNTTKYLLNDCEKVITFLEQHKGKKVFTADL